MKTNYTPCKGCTDREVGCHAKCERYAKYRKPFDKAIADREKRREAGAFHNDGVTKAIRRAANMKK